MTSRIWLLLLLAAPSVAFGAEPPSCPSSPVRVVRSHGGATDYAGTVPGIPDLCRITRADGAGNYYMGVWRTDWPGAGDAYPAIKEALNGPPGTKVTFITRSLPNFQFVDSFTNGGEETVTVGGHAYRTVKLAHERQGFAGNTYHSVITSWRDMATGIGLRAKEDQISGQSYGPNTTWEAVRVEPSPPG